MMNKRQISILASYLIALIVYCLLLFTIPFRRTPAVIVMFAFGILSLIIGCAITYYAFTTSHTVKSKLYGFPLVRISYLYSTIQFVVSMVFFILNKWLITPTWLAAVICILLLAAVLSGVIATDNTRDIIENIEKKESIQTKPLKTFRLDISSLASSCTDPEAKKQLEKLSEKLRYSDPVSSDALLDVETKITQNIEEITRMIDHQSYETLSEKIQQTDRLVDDRNRRCKAEKETP